MFRHALIKLSGQNLGMSNLTLMNMVWHDSRNLEKINKRLISIFVPVHDHFLVKKGGKIIQSDTFIMNRAAEPDRARGQYKNVFLIYLSWYREPC